MHGDSKKLPKHDTLERAVVGLGRGGQVGPRGAGWRGYKDRPSGAA